MDASDYMGRKVRAFVKRDLVRLLDACLNKTLGEVDRAHLFDAIRTKRQSKVCGIAGNVIEQSVLGYPANSDQAPDLLINGIATELKTTGIKQSKEAWVYEDKECLSVTAVSPDRIVHKEFDNSAFWHKLEHLLFVFYLYVANRTVPALEYANFKITGYEFYDFPESDRRIRMKDWQIVRDFIRRLRTEYKKYEDEYPRISSELRPQLMYIDTAPKWPHPPRFRLKRSVVTGIVQEHFQHRNGKKSERILNLLSTQRITDVPNGGDALSSSQLIHARPTHGNRLRKHPNSCSRRMAFLRHASRSESAELKWQQPRFHPTCSTCRTVLRFNLRIQG